MTLPVEAPPLPRRARAHADDLVFIERFEPAEQTLLDLETNRLVVQIQGGQPNAMTELYLLYFDRVYGYTRLALRDPHEAEDVTQQVFLKVVGALPRFEQRGVPIEAWLFRIVKNCIIDHARRSRRIELEDPFTLSRRRERLAPREPIAPPALAPLLASAAFEVAVSSLPPLQRQVLALRYQLDLPNARIAAILGRSDGAIRQAHYQALRARQARAADSGQPSSWGRLPFAMSRVALRRPSLRFARLRGRAVAGFR